MYIQEKISIDQLTGERLAFCKAIGVDCIDLDLRNERGGTGSARSVVAEEIREGIDCTGLLDKMREQVDRHGLKLNSVFMPAWEEITLAREDRDEKIGRYGQFVESLGRAGIPCLGWNFKPMGNFRTTSEAGRGGAKYSTFDYREFKQSRPEAERHEVNEEQMWERMGRFLGVVIPAAEKSGVTMALHPDDPPIPEPLGGGAQICSTLEQFRRILFDLAPSPSNRMLFCQGCMTELLGAEKVYDAIREMASKQKIGWVHFRNIRGRLPCFSEVFIDEGEVDMHRAMEIYRDHGFEGPYMMDHTPSFQDRQGLHGKAYAIGYIRALIQTVYS